MFKIKYFSLFSITLLLIGCSGSDDESISTLEATVTSSNDAPLYDETYTISWESNASQCYATSTTGSWLGELAPSGSQDFVAKREGTANYGVQCRKSINFVNASTDVVVIKDFINYFDFDDVQTRYVSVEFVLGGYPVEGVYDRSINVLKDVYVYGELVASSSVKLESLLSILQDRFLNEDLSAFGDQDLTIESLAQSAAIDYVANQLKINGFVVKIDDIAVVEELNAIYRVENTYLDGFENKRLMFDVLMANDSLVTDVLVIVDGSPIILEGKFSLEELAELVLSESDF